MPLLVPLSLGKSDFGFSRENWIVDESGSFQFGGFLPFELFKPVALTAGSNLFVFGGFTNLGIVFSH